MLFMNARVVTPGGVIGNGWVATAAGRIVGVGGPEDLPTAHKRWGGSSDIDLAGSWLGPGFIDIHVHGSQGIEMGEADVDGYRHIARFFALHGVTSYLAGVSTRAPVDTLEAVGRAREAMAQLGPIDGAALRGIHLEGPFISQRRRGAHSPALIRLPDLVEAEALVTGGAVRMVAFAPELEGAHELAALLRAHGVALVAGHTDASWSQMDEAIRWGVRSVTHVFNGMRGVHHREPGTAGAALVRPELTAEVIADGNHLDEAILRLLWRTKGADGIALITDAGVAGGLSDGEYDSRGRSLTVENGCCYLPDRTISGSARTFDENFRTFLRATGASIPEAWPCASEVPARIVGLGADSGVVVEGARADLVALDAAANVLLTVCEGHVAASDAG